MDVGTLLDAFAAHLDDGAPLPAIDAAGAVAIAEQLHAEVDRGTAARTARAAEIGHPVACHPGCAACCRTILVGAELDALAIAHWLGRAEHADARAHFAAAYPRWSTDGGALIAEARTAVAAGDLERLHDAMTAAGKAGLMCPFNREGSCTVYDVRPDVCRVAHALDTHENCEPGRTVRYLDFVPITAFLQRIRPLEDAIGAALPGAPTTRTPLAERVAELLDIRRPRGM